MSPVKTLQPFLDRQFARFIKRRWSERISRPYKIIFPGGGIGIVLAERGGKNYLQRVILLELFSKEAIIGATDGHDAWQDVVLVLLYLHKVHRQDEDRKTSFLVGSPKS